MKQKQISKYEADQYGWAYQERELLLKPYLGMMGNLEGKKVLDLGCGKGWITKILAGRAPKVVGVDISEDMISVAEANFTAPNIEYLALDGEKVSYIGEKFDLIVSSLMIHASKSQKAMIKTLRGCNKILKDNGELIILVPHPCFSDQNKRDYNTYTFFKKFNYFKRDQKYKVRLKSNYGVSEFVNVFYNLQQYFEAFKETGFVVSDVLEPKVPDYAKKKNPEAWTLELEKPFYIIFKLIKCKEVTKR